LDTIATATVNRYLVLERVRREPTVITIHDDHVVLKEIVRNICLPEPPKNLREIAINVVTLLSGMRSLSLVTAYTEKFDAIARLLEPPGVSCPFSQNMCKTMRIISIAEPRGGIPTTERRTDLTIR
jgi:hypothetical protein